MTNHTEIIADEELSIHFEWLNCHDKKIQGNLCIKILPDTEPRTLAIYLNGNVIATIT